jgi:hypothetical protein
VHPAQTGSQTALDDGAGAAESEKRPLQEADGKQAGLVSGNGPVVAETADVRIEAGRRDRSDGSCR